MHIPLILGSEQACPYLPDRASRSVYVHPQFNAELSKIDAGLYSELIKQGFRRSGGILYRPHCQGCSACIPVRIPVHDFKFNRSQMRTLKKNADLKTRYQKPSFMEEHYQLFKRYTESRHPDNKQESGPEEYGDFLLKGLDESALVEFRLDEKLLAVAVIDFLNSAISAVYTFYDPDLPQRSLGTFAVLWQIQMAKNAGLDWLYLGFWVEGSEKMDYKKKYRPLQALIDQNWRLFEKNDKIEA